MTRKKNVLHLPTPANINPPTKSITNFKNRIYRELANYGRWGSERQVIAVTSNSWDGISPSEWMRPLLGNPKGLREQLNNDFATQGWRVTWLEELRSGFRVKMTYDPR
tara:strand:+ start:138 stop:461 length:324 start_codon:yes stop_codon:yes gene_type:complete